MKSSITFWGGVEQVTGANFMFSFVEEDMKERRFLVDCGLTQGTKEIEERNRRPFPYDPSTIDMLFVTHAHVDHIGLVPKLVREGFRGKIVSTAETKALAEPMLLDALRLLEEEARKDGVLPIYERKDIENTLSLWESVPYKTPREYYSITVTLNDAGHILGSAMILFSISKDKPTNILFTGDLGNSPSPLLPDTEKVRGINYLVMESVYGDRNHEGSQFRREILQKALLKAVKKGGVVLIPSFSLEKTQVLLYEMNDLVEKGKIPSVPVYLDSPLAIKITEIYRQSSHLFNEKARQRIYAGDDILHFPKLKLTVTKMESDTIFSSPSPKIIIAGSGMSNGGRITKHEKNYLGDHKNTILFVGYQSAGTAGRLIEEGVRKVKIDDDDIRIRAEIVTIKGYSSHKDLDHLVEFVEHTADSLKKVFVVMGEPRSALFLCQRLHDYIGVNAVHPEEGEKVGLE